MRKLLLIFALLPVISNAYSQELYCTVTVEAPKNQSTDPQIFTSMETALAEFMNTRRWTDDIYLEHERVRCNIVINITDNPSEGVFGGSLLIQSERPIYNSSYNTPVFVYNDKDLSFEYIQFQNLDYNESSFSGNLTSVLAYYAYIILGYDYESFEQNAGTALFRKAEAVVNNIPSNERSKYTGWSPFDGTRNRYVLTDNILNPRNKSYNDALYIYHRAGLDNMYADPELGRKNVTQALKLLERIADDNPSSMLLRVFFLAKSDELINIYSKASSAEKGTMIPLLIKLDPTNADKYNTLYKL